MQENISPHLQSAQSLYYTQPQAIPDPNILPRDDTEWTSLFTRYETEFANYHVCFHRVAERLEEWAVIKKSLHWKRTLLAGAFCITLASLAAIVWFALNYQQSPTKGLLMECLGGIAFLKGTASVCKLYRLQNDDRKKCDALENQLLGTWMEERIACYDDGFPELRAKFQQIVEAFQRHEQTVLESQKGDSEKNREVQVQLARAAACQAYDVAEKNFQLVNAFVEKYMEDEEEESGV